MAARGRGRAPPYLPDLFAQVRLSPSDGRDFGGGAFERDPSGSRARRRAWSASAPRSRSARRGARHAACGSPRWLEDRMDDDRSEAQRGSSRSRTRGLDISARPIASICCSPPESVPAVCLRRSFRRGKRVKTRRRNRPGAAVLRAYAPISRFSWTERLAKTMRPSGTERGRPGRADASASCAWPRRDNGLSPPAAGTRPMMARSVVVFPAPLAPMSVTISPSASVSETP